MTKFGQVVLGPPGSGKSTYCKSMASLLKDLGRTVTIVNLDPANDELPFDTSIDIKDLVTVEEVMETQAIGPNGSLVFCLELLAKNINWLLDKFKNLEGNYFIFDFPGQVELYMHHTMITSILKSLESDGFRLCSVYLLDAHYANDSGKYVSGVLLALNSMLQMEIATVNVLSKIDSVEKFGKLQFGLDFYTEVQDLNYLMDDLSENPLTKKYSKLNKIIGEVVTDYSLVSFIPVSVDDRTTLIQVLKAIDKANGYVFGSGEERSIQRLLSCAVGAEFDHEKFGRARDLYSAEEEDDLIRLLATQNQHKL